MGLILKEILIKLNNYLVEIYADFMRLKSKHPYYICSIKNQITMQKIKENFGSVDSFKIRLPYDEVQIINKEIELNYIKWNVEENEALDGVVFKNNALSWEETQQEVKIRTGIKYRYAIEYQQTKNGLKKFVTILINSKWLRDRYFEGITLDSIQMIYSIILNQAVIHCTFEQLLEGYVTDLDIKFDFYADLKEYKNIIEYAKLRTKISPSSGTGYTSRGKPTDKNENYGIEWGVTRQKATPSKPFIKIYNKFGELRNKSTNFNDAYLRDCSINNLRRVEFTIKNKEHFKQLFDIEDNKLLNVLNLSQKQIKKALKTSFTKHFNDLIIKETITGLKGMDLIILRLCETLIHNTTITPEQIIDICINDYNNSYNKVQKSRSKKKITEIITALKENDLTALKMGRNAQGYEFFNALGVRF